MISVYAAVHFFVDFASAFLMLRFIAQTPNFSLSVLLYNFCAFALQLPFGVLADRVNRRFLIAILGCALLVLAYGFWQVPLAAVCLVGFGNCLFHLGGGIDVLDISNGKSGALGVFVAPGALGVYLGTMLGRNGALPVFPILLALLAAVALILAVCRRRGRVRENAAPQPGTVPSITPGVFTAAVCLFLVVCLRSYIGLALSFSWKSAGLWAFALVCAVVAGKIAGGFLADRFGPGKTAILSLSFATLLFLLPQVPVAGVLSVLLFNMTMPITLWALAKRFPGAYGFSFGLLSFGLFLGFLPVQFNVSPPDGPWMFAVGAVLSLALLWAGLRRTRP